LTKTNPQISFANKVFYVLCPLLTFLLALLSWSVLPLGLDLTFMEIRFNLLLILALSSLNVYSIILAGWSCNSKYALIGSLRVGAQMIAYEIAFTLMLLHLILCAGSLNLSALVAAQSSMWFGVQHFPVFVMFFMTLLAETNRHPFDFAEAESELVSGFNVEYGSMNFALFFLGEYANMILMSVLISLLFCGGWTLPFLGGHLPFLLQTVVLGGKTLFFMVLIVLARAAFPRHRYDNLMELGWKGFLPLNLAWFLGTLSLLFLTDGLPALGGSPAAFAFFYTG
jgi:NADH-quinone oxidoreductase subunit H